MKLDKNIGIWYDEKIHSKYEFNIIPTLLDDVAYHIYLKDKTSFTALPQVTIIFNKRLSNHKLFLPYYKQAERLLKIKKIKDGYSKPTID